MESKKARRVKRFLLFAISKPGQSLGTKLLYAPIPDTVTGGSREDDCKGQAGELNIDGVRRPRPRSGSADGTAAATTGDPTRVLEEGDTEADGEGRHAT